MRSLVVDEEVPYPLNSGKRIRTFNLLAPLAARHDITFVCRKHAGSDSQSLEPFGIRTSRKDATFAVDVRYALRSSGTKPYLGAGYALHFLASSVDAPSLGLNGTATHLVKGGFGFLGGLSFPLTQKIENFLELKYHHVPSYRQLKFNWGLAINL